MEYCFNLFNKLAADGTAMAVDKFLREPSRSKKKESHKEDELPVVLCIGSDLARIIAVDAAVGSEGDIGLIKVSDTPLFPGAGANKKLGSIGDISVMGIVAEKSVLNYGLLNTTRLNLVYSMAEIISDGLSSLLWEMNGRNRRREIV